MANSSRNLDILLLKLESFRKKEYSSHQNETDARLKPLAFEAILLEIGCFSSKMAGLLLLICNKRRPYSV